MKTALISVYDKDNIVEFSKELIKLGWNIVSTGGTFKLLKENSIDVMEVSDLTDFPEILGGRVKTLNPKIHGGILHRRDSKEDLATIENLGIRSIDLVVNNLYPFEEKLNSSASQEEIIENIDIGGPTMIRAAAKNFKDVTVVIDPEDYSMVLEELKNGDTSLETRLYLAGKVYNYIAYYDSLIANYFNKLNEVKFPKYLSLAFKDGKTLRYGENPHQDAAFYIEAGDKTGTIAAGKQLHGKELSFNNINDSNGALEALKEFDEPTVVAVKHANPCGIASASNIVEAYEKAYACDPISIFGGIIAANREVGSELAKKINEIFIEVVMAPSFTEEALEILTSKKNIRLIEIPEIMNRDIPSLDMKKVMGGFLVQDRDQLLFKDELELVTDREPSEEELKDLEFAWKAAKAVKSNGVLLVKDRATIGIGLGEVNRVWAVANAIERAGEKAKGAVLASDGFFPFKDSIEELAKAEVAAVIQPGGSIRDEEVIEEANKNNMTMLLTGMRHFKH